MKMFKKFFYLIQVDQDDDFESPPHSSDDEVDSDFDQPEEEENDEEGKEDGLIDEAERAERRQKVNYLYILISGLLLKINWLATCSACRNF